MSNDNDNANTAKPSISVNDADADPYSNTLNHLAAQNIPTVLRKEYVTLGGTKQYFKAAPSITVLDSNTKRLVDPREPVEQRTIVYLTPNKNRSHIDMYERPHLPHLIYGKHRQQPNAWEIVTLEVPRSKQGQGYGKALIEWIKDEADLHGVDLYLRVGITDCAIDYLISWYRRRGFRLISPGSSLPIMRRLTRGRLVVEVNRQLGRANMGFDDDSQDV